VLVVEDDGSIRVGAYRVLGPDGELAPTATDFRLLCELAGPRVGITAVRGVGYRLEAP
jgi:hypothetical protein